MGIAKPRSTATRLISSRQWGQNSSRACSSVGAMCRVRERRQEAAVGQSFAKGLWNSAAKGAKRAGAHR